MPVFAGSLRIFTDFPGGGAIIEDRKGGIKTVCAIKLCALNKPLMNGSRWMVSRNMRIKLFRPYDTSAASTG